MNPSRKWATIAERKSRGEQIIRMRTGTIFCGLVLLAISSIPFGPRDASALSIAFVDDEGNLRENPYEGPTGLKNFATLSALSKSLWWTDKEWEDLEEESMGKDGYHLPLFDENLQNYPRFPNRLLSPDKGPTGSTITILNGDGPNEGFNDPGPPHPASTAGGNPGATLGMQRQLAFEFAAGIWEGLLQSNIEILVTAFFDPLTPCSAGSGVLGRAGAASYTRDWLPGVGGSTPPLPATWYPYPLANAIANKDLATGSSDIVATFNSDIDDNTMCLSGINWYYGFDAAPPAGTFDLVTVVLHEIGHGLGFATITNQTGETALGFDDVYMTNLFDESLGLDWPSMTVAQRGASAINNGNLTWDGAAVTAATAGITGGVHASGRVRHYAPNPFRPGSSVSHWDTALSPNQLMEPFLAGANHDVGLAFELMDDIGWTAIVTPPTTTPTETSTDTPTTTATSSPTGTETPTDSDTPTLSPTFTITESFTPTPTGTGTFTETVTETFSDTVTPSSSPTETQTDLFTPTSTETPMETGTPTETSTHTATNTITNTGTQTATPTLTPTCGLNGPCVEAATLCIDCTGTLLEAGFFDLVVSLPPFSPVTACLPGQTGAILASCSVVCPEGPVADCPEVVSFVSRGLVNCLNGEPALDGIVCATWAGGGKICVTSAVDLYYSICHEDGLPCTGGLYHPIEFCPVVNLCDGTPGNENPSNSFTGGLSISYQEKLCPGVMLTLTPTETRVPTLTPTWTPTAIPPTITFTSTPIPTALPTRTATGTPVATRTHTVTNTRTPSAFSTPTDTSVSTATASETPTPTLGITLTASGTMTPGETLVPPTDTPSATPSETPRDFDIAPPGGDGAIDANDLAGWLNQILSGSEDAVLLFEFAQEWRRQTGR